MNTQQENLAFLQELAKKTVTWQDIVMRPNMSGGSFRSQQSNFTSYKISSKDFQKIITIINEDFYLLMPKESIMGYVEGYDVIDLSGRLILRFGKQNLPVKYDLKQIFVSIVQGQQNLIVYDELVKEKKLPIRLKKCFEEYCY